MVDLSRTNLSPIPVEASPLPAVNPVPPSPSILSGLPDLVSSGLQIFNRFQEQRQEGVVAEFTQRQLDIANAVDQGSITSTEGRMRLRANFSQYLQNNPNLAGQFQQAHRGIIGTTGLGAIVNTGNVEEQRARQLEDAAFKAGFFAPNASEQDIAKGVMDFQEFQSAARDLEMVSARLQQRREQATTTTAELNAQDALIKRQARTGLARLTAAYTPKYFASLQRTKDLYVNSSRTAEDSVQAQQALQAEWNLISAELAKFGADAGGDYANSLVAPMQKAFENTLSFVKGEIDLDALNNANESAIALSSAQLLADPTFSKAVAVSKQLGNVNAQFIPNLNAVVGRLFTQNGGLGRTREERTTGQPANLFADRSDAQSMEDIGTYVDIVKNDIQNSNSNRIPPGENKDEYNAEINTNLVNMVRGINAYKDSIDSADQYNQLVDFIADPATGKFFVEQGGIPAGVATTARDIIRERYENVVAPLVRDAYSQAMINTRTTVPGATGFPTPIDEDIPATEVLEPRFEGTGVVFRLREGQQNRLSGVQGSTVVSQLNRQLAPINRLIRMYSHLQGNTNYRATWDEIKADIFPELAEGDTQVGEPMTRPDPVGNVVQNLLRREGTGDELTGIPTGQGGITEATKTQLEASEGRSLTDEEARELFVQQQFTMLSNDVEGFSNISPQAQEAVLDLAFNVGPQVARFPGLTEAIRQGDEQEVLRQTLDTAQAEGQTVRGIASRRAELYNTVFPDDPITEVEQLDDGTIIYRKGQNEFFRFNTSGGRHRNSRPGVIRIQ